MSKAYAETRVARLLPELKADVVLLQETHVLDVGQMHCRGNIDGYKFISATYHKQYWTATYVRNDISNPNHLCTRMVEPVSVIATNVANITLLNIYKSQMKNGPCQLFHLPSTLQYSLVISIVTTLDGGMTKTGRF